MKSLKCFAILLLVGMFAFPTIVYGGPTGDGPPGWSHANPGQGGSGPGQGPGGSSFDNESAVLYCLSAIASQNPVLILEACDVSSETVNGKELMWNHKMKYKGIGGKKP